MKTESRVDGYCFKSITNGYTVREEDVQEEGKNAFVLSYILKNWNDKTLVESKCERKEVLGLLEPFVSKEGKWVQVIDNITKIDCTVVNVTIEVNGVEEGAKRQRKMGTDYLKEWLASAIVIRSSSSSAPSLNDEKMTWFFFFFFIII